MADGALITLALAASIAGMGGFALSLDTHWQQVMGDRQIASTLRKRLRQFAAALLAVAFVLCAMADPVSMAALVWPMLLTVAAAVVAASLALHARCSRHE